MSRGTHADISLLGRGVYTLADAAAYTGVHSSRLNAWLRAGSPRPTGWIEFLDLVESRVVGVLRDAGVTMSAIAAVHVELRRHLGVEKAFAHRDLHGDSPRLLRPAASSITDRAGSAAIVSGALTRRLREMLSELEYDADSSLASRWRIAEGVVIDPRISFGQPVVPGTGVTTFVLANCYWANRRDAALAAELFNVSVADVQHAVAFERGRARREAAHSRAA